MLEDKMLIYNEQFYKSSVGLFVSIKSNFNFSFFKSKIIFVYKRFSEAPGASVIQKSFDKLVTEFGVCKILHDGPKQVF